MKSLGYILYEGPSRFDHSPIVALASMGTSHNRKTGDMVQVWILPQKVKPSKAVSNGRDEGICNDCAFRPILARQAREGGDPLASCYVSTTNGGPNAVWQSYRSKRYEKFPWNDRGFAFDRPVRIGAYGDPTAVPLNIWEKFLRRCDKGWTAYTHQWKKYPAFQRFCMASVNNEAEQALATLRGWRTFRVIQKGDDFPEPLTNKFFGFTNDGRRLEIECPAAEHQGYALGERSTCAKCRLCDGVRNGRGRKNIVVHAH